MIQKKLDLTKFCVTLIVDTNLLIFIIMKQSTKESLKVIGTVVGVILFFLGVYFIVCVLSGIKHDIERKAVLEYIESTK